MTSMQQQLVDTAQVWSGCHDCVTFADPLKSYSRHFLIRVATKHGGQRLARTPADRHLEVFCPETSMRIRAPPTIL